MRLWYKTVHTAVGNTGVHEGNRRSVVQHKKAESGRRAFTPTPPTTTPAVSYPYMSQTFLCRRNEAKQSADHKPKCRNHTYLGTVVQGVLVGAVFAANGGCHSRHRNLVGQHAVFFVVGVAANVLGVLRLLG